MCLLSKLEMNLSSSNYYSKRKSSPDAYDEPDSYCRRPKNDVFMNYSFRDIGKGFISHLKGALTINSFAIFDHTMLPIGQDMCFQLLKAIDESEMYVVVFSTNYASSVRCLDELVDIMDICGKSDQRQVLPVFFKVEPSDISSQEGPFKAAFEAHETDINVDPERVQKWKQALQDVGQLSGLTLKNDGDEAESILKIVKQLEKMQIPLEYSVTEHPVGIGSRAEELISKLRLDCEDVLVVAVFGFSGIGKTTIVEATYNTIAAKFDASCFLEDIHRRYCGGGNWKVKLIKKITSDLTKNDNGKHRVTNIRRSIRGKKILLVLDDVDNFEQLEGLGINPAWFYKGSRIIVTTRDRQSLGNIPYTSYQTVLLNRRESLNLFTRLIFARDHTSNTRFVEEVVARSGGLPLVIKVWSRHFKQYEKEQWPDVLEKLKRIPHKDTQKKLQISYDSLSGRAKNLFLDIACFFDGMEKDIVFKVLHDEELSFFPDIEIQDLADKFLVENGYHYILMNHVIREMGQEVVRQENEDEPGKCTRLMDHRDVVHVFRDCSGTDSIRSIRIGRAEMHEQVTVQIEAFKTMSSLRFIQLLDRYRLQWSLSSNDDMSCFCFKHVKYLEWHGFPCKCLDISMGNVVVIKLQNSKLKILWEGFKSLKKLRILDVSHSSYLTKTGDFIGLENLEELCLKECSLEELHSSIGSLKSLTYMDISGNKFHNLPDSLCQLHQLSYIKLSGCANLRSIPNLPKRIADVRAESCINLVNLPSNMSELQYLTNLMLQNCVKLGSEGFRKVTGLRNLLSLSIQNCSVSQISSDIENLVSLELLNLSENTFSSIPESFSNLSELVVLYINNCFQLQSLPLLPSKLTDIEASQCWLLDIMPFDSMRTSYLFHSKVFKESICTEGLSIGLTGKGVPDWCNYGNMGNVLSFVAPMHLVKKICGVILCATMELVYNHQQWLSPTMLNKTKTTSHCFDSQYIDRCPMYVMFYPLDDTTLVVEAGDKVVLQFDEDYISSCGLHLVYEGDVIDSKLVIKMLPNTHSESHRR